MDLIDEIKRKIKIMDLAVEYGLEPGRNDFIFSIYKKENNRSLKIYPETNSFYCFSSGHGGDVINFYADYWRTDIKTAIKELAAKAGISNVPLNYKRELPQRNKKELSATRIPLFENEMEFFEERAAIMEFYERLTRTEAEIKAIKEVMDKRKEIQLLVYESLEKFCYGVDDETFDYLIGKDRNLCPETIKKFKLFSIKNVNHTQEYLRDNFTMYDLIISGLLNKTGYFVFTNHKLIIPYLENGKLIYIRGRRLHKDGDICKYISPYNFAGNLTLKRFYNTDALRRIHYGEALFVCEGEFDTMVMEQTGARAIGIPGVTNIPSDKIELIRNHNIYAAFDNDEAGNNAQGKFIRLLNKPVKTIKLKFHKDISELISER